MTADLLIAVCRAGHVATAKQLFGAGATRRAVDSAVAAGFLRRVARGVYTCAHVDGDLAIAARAGGQVDCVTSLERHTVWSGIEPPGLHLRMRPHHHQRRLVPGSVLHWSATHAGSITPFEVSPLDALLQAIDCLPPEDALASVESALHRRFITEDEFDELLLRAPERLHPILAKLDRGAESGFETHTRLMLVLAGFRVQTQFRVPVAGRLDLLVNGCVGVETDGEKWHGPERFIPDRTKDLICEGHGIRVLRIARPHIFDDWPRTLHSIRRMVSDAESGRLRKRRS